MMWVARRGRNAAPSFHGAHLLRPSRRLIATFGRPASGPIVPTRPRVPRKTGEVVLPSLRPSRSRRSRSPGRRLGDLILAGLLIWLLFRPAGPVGSLVAEQWEAWRASAAARRTLPELVEGGRTVGPRGAPVLVKFTDYLCPYCRLAHRSLEELRASGVAYRLVVRHVPVEARHPGATLLAGISVCAEGRTDYPAIHSALYGVAPGSDPGAVATALRERGVNGMAGLLVCARSRTVEDRLARDRELAEAAGVRGTPTFVGRRGMRHGAVPAAELASILGR